MRDAVYLLTTVAFYGCAALVSHACDRRLGPTEGDTAATPDRLAAGSGEAAR